MYGLAGGGSGRLGKATKMEPKMCSVTTECFISFSATPICFGNAAQFSQKKKKSKTQTFKSARAGFEF